MMTFIILGIYAIFCAAITMKFGEMSFKNFLKTFCFIPLIITVLFSMTLGIVLGRIFKVDMRPFSDVLVEAANMIEGMIKNDV